MLCFDAILAGKVRKNNQRWCLMCEEWRFLGQGRPLSVLMPEPSLEVWWEWTSEAGLPRSWPINSFEVFAVRVLLLWLHGLRVLQEVFIPLVLRLDVGADGGGALTLKATGQSCRSEAERHKFPVKSCGSDSVWDQDPEKCSSIRRLKQEKHQTL